VGHYLCESNKSGVSYRALSVAVRRWVTSMRNMFSMSVTLMNAYSWVRTPVQRLALLPRCVLLLPAISRKRCRCRRISGSHMMRCVVRGVVLKCVVCLCISYFPEACVCNW